MAISPEDRVLRRITVYTSAPGILLLIVHTLLTRRIVPIFGIIPMVISACSGLVHSSTRAANVTTSAAIDIFIALYLGTVVSQLVIFVHGYHGWCGHGDEMMLAAYGTVPLIINWYAIYTHVTSFTMQHLALLTYTCSCIHTFFALRATPVLDLLTNLFSSLFEDVLGRRPCPSCQCEHDEATFPSSLNSPTSERRNSKEFCSRGENAVPS